VSDVKTIEQSLSEHPFFAGLGEESLALLAACASPAEVGAGDYLFHEGDAADVFYAVLTGRVTIELHPPAGGGVVLDTAHDGDVVGWSWLVPPGRWMFDARASHDTSVIAFDADCLRRTCEENPRLGYELAKRVAHVMARRLQSARIRLLDIYGAVHD
jgi:CRP/FNR family cyclic AMP-dependent transcriptional regulator